MDALEGVTAALPAGIIGLLGPNGAGKTTLLRLILGLEAPSAGSISVLGWPIPGAEQQARAEVGYMPDDDCLFPSMTGLQQLECAGRLSGLSTSDAKHRAHRCLDLVGLAEARGRDARGYSLGMRQRLRLAMAIVHGPRLVLLDEPTAGLDPAGRDEMLGVIAEIGAAGTTVLLSTHVLTDVAGICDYVLLLSGGKLGYCGPMSSFFQAVGGERWHVEFVGGGGDARSLLADAGLDCWPDGSGIGIRMAREQHAVFWALARDQGLAVRGFWPAQESIGDAFVRHLRLDDVTRRQGKAS